MKTVWKYALPIVDDFEVEMPAGAQVVHVDMQGDESWFWAIVDPGRSREYRKFSVAGTGHTLGDGPLVYLGTFQDGSFVWHLFEKV